MPYKNFTVETFLNKEDVNNLKKLYDETDMFFCARDHSLYGVFKGNIGHSNSNPAFIKINNHVKKTQKYSKLDSAYFLKYPKYSWTRAHVDNPNKVKNTLITMIDESPDLVGGETLVWDKFYALPVKDGEIVRGSGGVEALHKKDDLICTPRLKSGDTLIYGPVVKHGVSQVESGYRIVLVTWYI